VITALSVEWLKFRSATIFWFTTPLIVVGVPLMSLGFVAIARSGTASGRLSGKLEDLTTGSFALQAIGLSGQVLAVALLGAGGIVAAWATGREFADGTIGSLFALPVSRWQIASAKSIIVTGWSVVVALIATGLTTLGAWIVDPAGMSDGGAAAVGTSIAVGVLTSLLVLPFGVVATLARGYLSGITALILVVVATQLIAALGGGAWFPFSVPALLSGSGGAEAAATIGPVQILLVPLVAVVSFLAVSLSWRRLRL
jgi:ABC-2 type transport system permease protein